MQLNCKLQSNVINYATELYVINYYPTLMAYMSRRLPTGYFKWETSIARTDCIIRTNTYDDDDTDYILNVELTVSKTPKIRKLFISI